MTYSVRETLRAWFRTRAVRRSAFGLALASAMAVLTMLVLRIEYRERAAARLTSATQRFEDLTDAGPADDVRRAAVAWGYAERLRLGLESPFRLIEAAARDPRLTDDERRTVSWALLAHLTRGESHEVDPSVLDGIGPVQNGRSVAGVQHLQLIDRVIQNADNPRAAELAVRFAYALAQTERLVDGSASVLTAQVAALRGDGEIARREAMEIVRGHRDPIDEIRRRRMHRTLYVERPALLAPDRETEGEAVVLARTILDAIRGMRPGDVATIVPARGDARLAARLFAAGAMQPPASALTVTVKRYLPGAREEARHLDVDALARVHNAEMLLAVTRLAGDSARSAERQWIARLELAAAVAARAAAQERVWFPGDSVPSAASIAVDIGASGITFDRDVPAVWRPYVLQSFAAGISDLRRVLPSVRLAGITVRFRLRSPADSALAMHDPRTRTLHLPVLTWEGTLAHELAHDLDRQSAVRQGLGGYRSDVESRRAVQSSGRLAASLRGVTEEVAEVPRVGKAVAERPAEIFATRVDWFVANALATQGISSGYLSAVQDEQLTGHVVHPERLRITSRSRSLVVALQEMTNVPPDVVERIRREPGAQTLLRWALAGPVDRRVASEILRGEVRPWMSPVLLGARSCDTDHPRAQLVRMAAESRARGWIRLRARWTADSARAPWARATLRQGPWSDEGSERRVAELRDYILTDLAAGVGLPAGLSGYGSALARQASCD